MRQLWMGFCLAALAFPPACGAFQTEASPPRVSYNYTDDDYEEVADLADNYCERNYGRDDHLRSQETAGDGYQVTFSCD